MNFAKAKPFYVSLSLINNSVDDNGRINYLADTDAEETIDSQIVQYFNPPLVNDATDWICWIERLEISLNGVPFYLAEEEKILVKDQNGVNPDTEITFNETVYTLSNLLTRLSAIVFTDPNGGGNFSCVFSLNKDGYITLKLLSGMSFNNLYFQFPRKLNLILGISRSVQTAGTAAVSKYTRIDCGDHLVHIVITSSLPTASDTIGNVPLQVLTDFAPGSEYSSGLKYNEQDGLEKSSWSVNTRQKAIYNPAERRFLDLNGGFNIQNIVVNAYYTDIDGNSRQIPLPLGGVFEIKIGFAKKE